MRHRARNKHMKQVYIVKADGTEELFDPGKLETSLTRAGADADERTRVIAHVMRELEDGMTTNEIYSHAFEILRKEGHKPIAARYSVKRAVLDLGPSGYPFEQFVAEILKGHGWRCEVGVIKQGRCTEHEIDVLAQKDGKRIGIEAKFHNSAGIKTDVKDALYVHARFEDLKQSAQKDAQVDEGWLVTNTEFTSNAAGYGSCVDLTLIGWEHPKDGGIRSMIDTAGVHPITALTTLTDSEKKRLLEHNIVLCRSVSAGSHLLSEYGVANKRIPEVIEEAKRLCMLGTNT